MLAKRIIPCLDVKDGRTVKGTRFVGLRYAGDPVELAVRYCDEGADELVFLDITATHENRDTLRSLVKRVAAAIDIPFTVGGGVRSADDVEILLASGADKVSINSAAVHDPDLIAESARRYGSQCIVAAIDAKKGELQWTVWINGGRVDTARDVVDWSRELVNRGAGEILLTSMDADGTKSGFNIELCRAVSEAVNVPLIASGGAGSSGDFIELFQSKAADAALAASIFHFGEVGIAELKRELARHNIEVRL